MNTGWRLDIPRWRSTLALILVCVTSIQPLVAEGLAPRIAGGVPAKRLTQTPIALTGSQRTLHALNRFTFGPRLGDVAAVAGEGLDRWFEQQLNPAEIADRELDRRLDRYPAMRLSVAELTQRYPGPQVIRQMIAGRIALPADPGQRALVEDQMALYKHQRAMQQEKKAPAVGTPKSAEPKPLGAVDPVAHARLVSLVKLPADQRMRALLALSPDELVSLREAAKGGDLAALRVGLTPVDNETVEALNGPVRMISAEANQSRLLRDVYSERQLEAVMTDFWLNHFNVYDRKNQSEPYLIPTFERQTIRAHALGSFEDLLVATAESPAMLEYLDNARSIGPDSPAAARGKRPAGLNENYGRELMELHTLGVNGGYSQADVTQVAKVFTGWTVQPAAGPLAGDDPGGFTFIERRHEPGPKMVLGKVIPEGGMQEGLTVLHMLATSPATARFISTKLAVRFVSDTPPTTLINRLTASYLKSHGDIRTVLRTLWRSPELWSPEVYHAKVKTPEEFVISAVRASGAEVDEPAALVQCIAKLGMPFFGMQTPQGYSAKQDDWVSTGALVNRMNFALVLASNHIAGTRMDFNSLQADRAAMVVSAEYSAMDAAGVKEFGLESSLMAEPVSAKTREAVLSQGNDTSVAEQAAVEFDLSLPGKGGISRPHATPTASPPSGDLQAAVMAGLLLGSPEFQRR